LKIVDYVYLISDGAVVSEGTVEVINQSTNPFVRQFVDARPDGPVSFHYPAANYKDMLLNTEGLAS